jgi:tyrosyl-tRNA synthetase
MFGKLMSISDTLMWRYFELLSSLTVAEIAALKSACEAGRNPRDVKVQLAGEMVTRFHGAAAAEAARAGFDARFSKGALPEDLESVTVSGAPLGISQLLREAGLVASGSEALRNVEQGGVRIDGEKVTDKGLKLGAGTYVVQVGKRRAARVTVS